MTILGVVAERDRILAWSDTEVFLDGKSHRHAAKLLLNSLGFFTVGHGAAFLAREAASVIVDASSLDEAVAQMPARLRKMAAKLATVDCRDETWFFDQLVVAAGYSERHERMLAYRFGPGTFLEPVIATRVIAPSDDALGEAFGVHNVRDVPAFARQQMLLLRKHLPDASGGALTVLEVRPNIMTVHTFPDFDVAPQAPPFRETEGAVQ